MNEIGLSLYNKKNRNCGRDTTFCLIFFEKKANLNFAKKKKVLQNMKLEISRLRPRGRQDIQLALEGYFS